MKKLLLLSFIFLFLASSLTYSQPVKFLSDWNEALIAASKQHKMIYLDAYTNWCSWCKKMEQSTFTDSVVNQLLKDNFIPLKLEMETGFNRKIAMKFRIISFPTALIFSPEGKLIFQHVGYDDAQSFTELLKNVLDSANHVNFKGITPEIELAFPKFYIEAFEQSGYKSFPDSIEVNDFLDTRSDLFSEVCWSVMYRFGTTEKYDKFFLENSKLYRELFGDYEINQKLYTIFHKSLEKAQQSKSEKQLDSVINLIDKYAVENKELEKHFYKLLFYRVTQDWQKIFENLSAMIQLSNYEYSTVINEYCKQISKACTDTSITKQCEIWMKDISKIKPEFTNIETYGMLLYRNNKFDEAEKVITNAIELGKANNKKTVNAETLLNEIKTQLENKK